MTHGEIIRRALEIKNITPAELSRMSAINRHTIYTIINKNQVKTNACIYKPIALALGLPESVFTDNQAITREKLDAILFSFKSGAKKENENYLLELMKKYNRTPEFVLNGLAYVSFYGQYASYDIETLLLNAYEYDYGLFRYIENLIIHGVVATRSEYHMIDCFRALDPNKQQLMSDLLSQLIESQYHLSEPESVTKNPVENEKMNQLWSSMEKEHGRPLDVQRTP